MDLIYYEYNEKKELLVPDDNYSNKYKLLEFFKITYYLTKKNIKFKVLKNKSIAFHYKKFDVKGVLNRCVENIKNNNNNIFLLNDKKVKFAKNIPLFEIVYSKKNIDLSNYDALIFTSKHAVQSIEANNKEWKRIPSFAISEQTAKLIKDFNGNLKFAGKEKHGNEFAHEIIAALKDKKVLYLRGDKIVSDMVKILQENGISCDENIIYENKFKDFTNKISLPKNSKIIFSSPSTIEYFLKMFSWESSYTAISIGNTTAKYFPEYIKPVIAENTSLKACVEKALELNNKNL